MKRTAMQHSKLRKLARLLDAPHYAAVGLLESLWHLVARETPAGNIGKLDDCDIAHSLDWRGDPAQLMRCLVEAGWVDESREHRLIVHDWHVHSDDAVDNLLARAGLYYACGLRPRMTRLAGKEKDELIARFYSDNDAPKKPVDAVRTESHKNALPEPLPEPEPKPEANTPLPPAQAQGECGAGDAGNGERSGTVVPISGDRSTRERSAKAVESVMLACDSGDRKLRRAVQGALESALRNGLARGEPEEPEDVGGRMAKSWREFTQHGPRMRYRLGPVNFFAQGFWANDARWPWDERKFEEWRRARAGM